MTTDKSIEEISEVVRDYVDGVVEFDFDKGESAWHPRGLKISLDSEGKEIVTRTISQTRPNLTDEEINAVKTQISQKGIIELFDRTGKAASVKLVWHFEREGQKKKITDYVLLLETSEGWKIVGKIHNEEVQETSV